jgi:hypothetical protein
MPLYCSVGELYALPWYLWEVSFEFRLLTPPGTPLFPPSEKDSQKTVLSQIEIPNVRPTAPKSRVRALFTLDSGCLWALLTGTITPCMCNLLTFD